METMKLPSFLEIYCEICHFTACRQGLVKFDEHGDRETSIEILQQQGDARVVVSLYNKSKTDLDGSLMKWDGKLPKDGVIIKTKANEDSVAYTVTIICLSIGGIVVSFLCLAVNIAFRKHRVIKMSSPHFNNITAVGGFICYLYVILGTVNHSRTYFGESHNVCTIRAYLIVIGFTLVFGGMFAKTWRVYKIFTNRRLKREIGGLSTVQLMLGIFCILVVDIVVLVSWNLIDPMHLRTVEISVNTNQEDIEIHTTTQQCVSNYYSSWIIGLILFKGALLLFGVFLAWETRNVHYAELNDSRNIGVAVYNILLFSGVSITAEFVLSDLMAKRIFNNSVIYLCATMVLGLVFIPKISRLARRTKVQPDEGQQQNKTQISTSQREADSQASRE